MELLALNHWIACVYLFFKWCHISMDYPIDNEQQRKCGQIFQFYRSPNFSWSPGVLVSLRYGLAQGSDTFNVKRAIKVSFLQTQTQLKPQTPTLLFRKIYLTHVFVAIKSSI